MLHHFFDNAARRNPNQIAIDVPPGAGRSERTRLTYAELASQAESLADVLGPLVRHDSIVAILLARGEPSLYVAQLAVLKAGAAFTCIDPGFPDAHLQAVIDDCAGGVLLTDAQGVARVEVSGIRVEKTLDVTNRAQATHATRAPSDSGTLADLAYVIYTSGTTGKPKGVMIEHGSIVNLVESDLREFTPGLGDRVVQGSSPAYDSSVEETWLALAAGATLVVMDEHAGRLGPDLTAWLRRERVTVFCPPPTLLRTMACTDPQNELPDLRLLYVGGEALTEDLAWLWARGRRLVNGYGPTECTVTVVRGDVRVGEPVTIGRPVPGHTAWVLDSSLQPVEDGEEGELCIGGPGLARGYRNRDEVTREKFPVHSAHGRIYRTGDLVRKKPGGELVYLGRMDAQVKLRGYRVELEAIEATLARCPGVREVACCVQGEASEACVAAHIVPIDAGEPPDSDLLRRTVRGVLPAYMVPSRFGVLNVLPRSVGGKIDRKRLPVLSANPLLANRAIVEPVGEIERVVADAFAKALRTRGPISTGDDFFLDLGGDSLSAVGVVCALRAIPDTAQVTTRDLYDTRTAQGLAARLEAGSTRRRVSRVRCEVAREHEPHPALITALQALWVVLQVSAGSAGLYLLVFEFVPFMFSRFGMLGTLALEVPLAFMALMGHAVLSVALTVGLKRVLIGRYETIRVPVWSWYYFRHWIVQSSARTIPWSLLAGTLAYTSVLRLLGARVGRHVYIHRGVNLSQGGWDLLTLGDGVTLSRDVHLGLVELDAGGLCIGSVTIGPDATLETRASVGPDSVIEVGGYLSSLSWLASGETIPAGQRWEGVPAAHAGRSPEVPQLEGGGLHPGWHTALHIGGVALARASGAIPVLVCALVLSQFLAISPADVGMWLLEPTWSAGILGAFVAAAIAWVPLALAGRALLVRFTGRVRVATMSRWDLKSILVWHTIHEVESAGTWLSGTLFWPIWLRLAGMRIGRDCEISTIIDVIPSHQSIGEGSFLADGIYLGGPRVHRGSITLARTSLGRSTFVGNHAVIRAGDALADDVFIGVCTVSDAARMTRGTSWFGRPALELPRREVVHVDPSLTHRPGALRYCTRLFWESLRFALPVVPLLIASAWLWMLGVTDAGIALCALAVAPLATIGVLAGECLLVIGLKWVLLARARPGQHALWSCWCSRWDFLYVAWQFYAIGPLVLLEGTLLLCAYLRATGMRIGRRVVLGPGFGQVADPDMIVIEDGATVCANYQAHSFEDRVLKLAPVTVRRGATVGEGAVVFFGADIAENAWVTPGSVVMKNESLAQRGAYSGCPVQPIDAGEPVVSSHAVALGRVVEAPARGRLAHLDGARGLAVIGMIFMHLVPADFDANGVSGILNWLSAFLEGKAAALFCILAGAAWELGASGASRRARGVSYWIRRSIALFFMGVILHLSVWPTEILVPFALMMPLAVLIRHAARSAVPGVAAIILILALAIPMFFSEAVGADWNDDGSHVADSALGWGTLRLLLMDGNYPIIPWLAFGLIGMTLVECARGAAHRYEALFAWAIAVYLVSQSWVFWAGAHADALGPLAPYATSTWTPTSIPFVLVTGSFALMVIGAVGWRQAHRGSGQVMSVLACFGRASLTHYLAHITLVYVPMKAILRSDGWSAGTGVLACAGYLLIAMPLSVLWFRRFSRGPIEYLWHRASG